jgi:hypothetical protein
MDWAKERKQQFLRSRAKGVSINSRSDHTEPLSKTETETWIETWYTPPSLPSRMARQKVISSDALYQKIEDAEAVEVKDAQGENQPKSQAPEFKNLPSSLPSTSSINGMNPGASPGRCFAPRGGECTQRDSRSLYF